MAGEFGHKPAERQLGDIEAVQQGVQDTSGATKMSAFAGALSTASQAVGVVGQQVQRNEAQAARDASAAAAELDEEYGNRYTYALDKMSHAVSSGQMSDAQARTFLTSTKRELISMGANADKLMATESKSLKTLSGKALAEGSKLDQLEDKEWDDYMASPFALPSSATMEEHEKQMTIMQKSQAEDLRLKAEQREVSFKNIEKNRTKAQREEDERQADKLATDGINKGLTDFMETAPQRFAVIGDTYQEERATIGEPAARANAEAAVQTFVTQSMLGANQLASTHKTGAKVQLEMFTDTVDKLQAQFLDNIGDVRLSAKMKQVQDEQKLKTSFALLNTSENTKTFAAVKDLFGPNALVLFPSLGENAKADVNQFVVDSAKREAGGPPPKLEVGSESEEVAFKVMSTNLKDYADGTYEGEVESLEKAVSGQLAHIADNIPKLTEGQVNKLIKELESPAFGSFVKNRGLSNEDVDNAKRVMFDHKESVADNFKTFIQDQLSALSSRNRSRTRRGAIAAAKVAEMEDLDVVFEGGQVMVRALTEAGRNEAKELNDKISGPLTRIVRVDANLSGYSQEKVFNSWKPQLWPEQGEQTQEQSTQEMSAQDVDWSQYEDGTYEGPDGTQYTVTDGVLVEAGS